MKYTILIITFALSVLIAKDNTVLLKVDGIVFKNGNLMTDASVDPFGASLAYPAGEPSVTTTMNVWEPGFESPWHYHPYSGPVVIIQGELTVDFDNDSSLDDLSSEKTSTVQSVYKAGDSFLAVSNTWHVSSNQGSEDLVFMVSWLGEKGEPVKVLNNK